MLAYETFIDAAADVDALEMRVSLFSMTRTLCSARWRDTSPIDFAELARTLLIGLLGARDRAEAACGKKLLVRLGLSRTFESEAHYDALAKMLMEHATALCGLGVLGILSGPEKEPLQSGLVRVIESLLPALPDLVIHAGEFDDHKSVERALALKPRGIGHGVRALESAAVLERLAKEGVTLELCPSSNALLIPETIAALREAHSGAHPICALQKHHVHSVLGSDDPVPMNTTFQDEWAQAVALGVDMQRLAHDSARRFRQLARA